MVRQIVCFQIPALQIALARLNEASLRRRPVAVAPPAHRTTLLEVSAEASAEGLHAGMPLDQARFLCPSLRIIAFDAKTAQRAHNSLQDLVRRFTPLWEPIGSGHFYLDLTGTARLFGRAVDTAARIEREAVERWGLNGVLGVATSKLVSGIAAKDILKPPDLRDVTPGGEKKYLAPVLVSSLPSLSYLSGGRTPEFLELLQELDLATLGKIAGTPPDHLDLVVGPRSRLMQQWAVGFDPTPVWPRSSRPSLEVSHTLNPDEVDDEMLLALLYGLLEKLCRRLRFQQRLCRSVNLDLVQSDGWENSKRAVLERASHWEGDIYPRLEPLFFRAFQRRVRVRKMTLRAEALENAEKQLALFPEEPSPESVRTRRLASALDRVRSRYGEAAIQWAGA
ncbi:MAG: DNA polymerase Y family protein [Candidatus Binatia bacterium]